MLTEGGAKKRARVGLFTPDAIDAELAHLGPEALGLGTERLGEILGAEPRRLHPLLRDQRALAGIGRAWSNEILHQARLSPYALSTELDGDEIERLASAVDKELAAWSRAAWRGARGRPRSTVCTTDSANRATSVRRRSPASIRGAHHLLLPRLPDAGRVLKDRRLSRLLR